MACWLYIEFDVTTENFVFDKVNWQDKFLQTKTTSG